MAFAHKKSAVIAVAVVFVLSVTVRVAASIEVGQAQVTLNGVVAPPPSSSACGFALIAPQEGAQIAIMGWSEFVVAARRGEEACVEISISGLEAATTVTAEVVHLEGTAEVVLSLDDESANRRALAEGKVSLSVSSLGRHQRVVLRLRTRALSNETAVQWRRIRFSTAKRSWDVNQFGGIRWPPTRPTGNGAPPVLPPMRRPIEQALIEWDWRMQDGIGTDRNPSAYDEAIGRTLKRGDELISDLRAAGVDLDR
ncbi:hypothetical protein FJY63_15170, partial [Candidatus Sumerlaeota bacterium]|nr:hypothetical protein [Candidatus Sumerlaeota bacterium]